MANQILNLEQFLEHRLAPWLQPCLLLFCRLWVSWVFFRAGLSKIQSWDSTLFLFEYEYQVPFLSFKAAAYIATFAELSLPLILASGLYSRLSATLLFGFNIMAVVSYPLLWERGFYDHQLWGFMLMVVMIFGGGKWAVEQLLKLKDHG